MQGFKSFFCFFASFCVGQNSHKQLLRVYCKSTVHCTLLYTLCVNFFVDVNTDASCKKI